MNLFIDVVLVILLTVITQYCGVKWVTHVWMSKDSGLPSRFMRFGELRSLLSSDDLYVSVVASNERTQRYVFAHPIGNMKPGEGDGLYIHMYAYLYRLNGHYCWFDPISYPFVLLMVP